MIGIPERLEGPTLIYTAGERHGLSLANAIALVPLALGSLLLLVGAWARRHRLERLTQRRPVESSALLLLLGLGLLLLLASGPSTMLRYWASGSFLTVSALFGLAALATLEPLDGIERQ
jgi:hypothetical protein